MKRSRAERRARRQRLGLVRLAASQSVFAASSMTDGLRALLLFESINGLKADPANWYHRLTITNTGWHFHLQRKLAAIQSGRETQSPKEGDHD